jgi:hypothetical protein
MEVHDVDEIYDKQQEVARRQGVQPERQHGSRGAADGARGTAVYGAPVTTANYSDALHKAALYVNKIKLYFKDKAELFRQFLELLRLHKTQMISVQDVYRDVSALLVNAPDLLEEFAMFLPEAIQSCLKSSVGKITHENLDAWISDMAPAIPICIVFVDSKEPEPKDEEKTAFIQAVRGTAGTMAVGTVDVDAERELVTNLPGKMLPQILPHWRLYHKCQLVAELPRWPKLATLRRLIDIKSAEYGWKTIIAKKPYPAHRTPQSTAYAGGLPPSATMQLQSQPVASYQLGIVNGDETLLQPDQGRHIPSAFVRGKKTPATCGFAPHLRVLGLKSIPTPGPGGSAFAPGGGAGFRRPDVAGGTGAFRPPQVANRGKMSLDNMLSTGSGPPTGATTEQVVKR